MHVDSSASRVPARPAARRRRSNGRDMTGIHQHQVGLHKGKWFAKVENGRDPFGKAQYKKFGPSFDLDDIVAKRDRHVAARKASHAPQPVGKDGERSFGWWVEQYLTLEVQGRKSDSTYDIANQALRVHAKPLHGIALINLDKAMIGAWVNSIWKGASGTLSSATVNGSLSKLKVCLEAALDPGYRTGLVINYARGVRPVPADDEVEYIPDPADTRRLVEAYGDSYMAGMIIVASDLGLRRSEIVALRWADVNLSSGEVTLRQHAVTTGHGAERKTVLKSGTKASKGKPETIWMTPHAIQALLTVRERLLAHAGPTWQVGQSKNGYSVPLSPVAPEAMVFPFHDGHMYEPNTLGSEFDRFAAKAGVKKTLHKLRHDCGSFLLARGAPLTVVSKHLRHKNMQTTMDTYLHQLKSQEQDAPKTMAGIWDELGFERAA